MDIHVQLGSRFLFLGGTSDVCWVYSGLLQSASVFLGLVGFGWVQIAEGFICDTWTCAFGANVLNLSICLSIELSIYMSTSLHLPSIYRPIPPNPTKSKIK